MASRRAGGLALACGLAVAALAIAWLPGQRQRDDGSLQRVRAAGELRIGYAVEHPFAFVDAQGQVTGESAESARELARRLGLRERWVQTSLDRVIDELDAGRFDVIGTGLFVTPERARRLHFLPPSLIVRPGWLTRHGEPAPQPPSGAAAAVPRVAVVGGSAAEPYLSRSALAAGLLRVPDARSGVVAVAARQADALALRLPAARQIAAERPAEFDAWPADDSQASLAVALAMRRGDISLAAAADSAWQGWVGSARHRAVLAASGLSADDLPSGADGLPAR